MQKKQYRQITNLNDRFNGKFDQQNDLLGYIDEAGDEGFDFSKGCTKWFVVGGLVTTYNGANDMHKTLELFRLKYAPNTPIYKLSFKELRHNHRKSVVGMLAKHKYMGIASVFHKIDFDENDKKRVYPSMYFYGIVHLIERMSWLTQQYGKNRIHILISARNNISVPELKSYLFHNSVLAGANKAYLNKIGKVVLSTHKNHPKSIFGDYTASSLYQYFEKNPEGVPEETYANAFLKGRMYSSNHKTYGGVWRNGLKCTPDVYDLIENSGILEEGSHSIF